MYLSQIYRRNFDLYTKKDQEWRFTGKLAYEGNRIALIIYNPDCNGAGLRIKKFFQLIFEELGYWKGCEIALHTWSNVYVSKIDYWTISAFLLSPLGLALSSI